MVSRPGCLCLTSVTAQYLKGKKGQTVKRYHPAGRPLWMITRRILFPFALPPPFPDLLDVCSFTWFFRPPDNTGLTAEVLKNTIPPSILRCQVHSPSGVDTRRRMVTYIPGSHGFLATNSKTVLSRFCLCRGSCVSRAGVTAEWRRTFRTCFDAPLISLQDSVAVQYF